MAPAGHLGSSRDRRTAPPTAVRRAASLRAGRPAGAGRSAAGPAASCAGRRGRSRGAGRSAPARAPGPRTRAAARAAAPPRRRTRREHLHAAPLLVRPEADALPTRAAAHRSQRGVHHLGGDPVRLHDHQRPVPGRLVPCPEDLQVVGRPEPLQRPDDVLPAEGCPGPSADRVRGGVEGRDGLAPPVERRPDECGRSLEIAAGCDVPCGPCGAIVLGGPAPVRSACPGARTRTPCHRPGSARRALEQLSGGTQCPSAARRAPL